MSQEQTTVEKHQVSSAIFADVVGYNDEGVSPDDKEIFKKSLEGSGFTYEQVIGVQDLLQDRALGFYDAATRKGIDHLVANPSLTSTVATLTLGRDQVVVDVQKEAQFRNPRTGETTTRNGASTLRYVARSNKRGADYKRVNEGLQAYALSKFGGK